MILMHQKDKSRKCVFRLYVAHLILKIVKKKKNVFVRLEADFLIARFYKLGNIYAFFQRCQIKIKQFHPFIFIAHLSFIIGGKQRWSNSTQKATLLNRPAGVVDVQCVEIGRRRIESGSRLAYTKRPAIFGTSR